MPWAFYDKNGTLKQSSASIVNPVCRRRASVSTSVTSGTAWVQVAFDTVDIDNIGTMTSGSNVLIPSAGKYLVTATVSWSGNVNGIRECFVGKNGTASITPTNNGMYDRQTGQSFGNVHQITTTLDLSAGDQISVYVQQNSGATLTTQGINQSVLSVEKIDGAVTQAVPYPVSLVGQEVSYAEFVTASGGNSVSATSFATGTTVVAAPAFTADGTSRYRFELYVPGSWTDGSTYNLMMSLSDSGTDVGSFSRVNVQQSPATTGIRFLTPTAGTHVYSVVAWITGTGLGHWIADSGGAGKVVPGFLRITRAG